MGHHRVCQLQAAQGAGVRASEATASGQREIRKVLVGLGRISEADTYRHTHPLFTEIGKKMDTQAVRIGNVSIAYPYRIRIRYTIQGPGHVSV